MFFACDFCVFAWMCVCVWARVMYAYVRVPVLVCVCVRACVCVCVCVCERAGSDAVLTLFSMPVGNIVSRLKFEQHPPHVPLGEDSRGGLFAHINSLMLRNKSVLWTEQVNRVQGQAKKHVGLRIRFWLFWTSSHKSRHRARTNTKSGTAQLIQGVQGLPLHLQEKIPLCTRNEKGFTFDRNGEQ